MSPIIRSVGQYNVDRQLYLILLPVFGHLDFGPDCGQILAGLKMGLATGPRPTGGPILKISRIGFGRSAAPKPLKCGQEALAGWTSPATASRNGAGSRHASILASKQEEPTKRSICQRIMCAGSCCLLDSGSILPEICPVWPGDMFVMALLLVHRGDGIPQGALEKDLPSMGT